MPLDSRQDPESPIEAAGARPLRVLLIAGSQRRLHSCPGLDSKARALMQRMAAALPAGWQIDMEDIGNEHGKPKIQSCNACVSSSMALCVWPCNCYGPGSDHQPDLLWNLDLYARLARADAWAIIGPVNWYSPSSNLKTMFDRLVCMNGGNPRPDLIDKKDTFEGPGAGAFTAMGGIVEKSPGRAHRGFPRNLQHPEWFDAKAHPQRGADERQAYEGLVWQCRYSDIEVPDDLWACTTFGAGKPFADDQVDDMIHEKKGMAAFETWVKAFAAHVQKKGVVPGTKEAEASAATTTNQDKKKI